MINVPQSYSHSPRTQLGYQKTELAHSNWVKSGLGNDAVDAEILEDVLQYAHPGRTLMSIVSPGILP